MYRIIIYSIENIIQEATLKDMVEPAWALYIGDWHQQFWTN